ncbi:MULTISPECIES: AI-2E family transporter [Enterococcus]|jgi:predicted PurR-regulated permease PerM|uniref:AI-2E family transporter n=1 Tax=Enterococcus TaxID=1350 RepID=UPI00189D4447|nr:AI-2E family transporter [Enterococcus dispar]MCU7357729.1 AI-2E family transporter [Enterococcus dispar]MDT2706264.1 AI-2E family transporter [Enterococcus dispar]WCG34162.1 AI-2E family transporter [Enterococcus dispar]
MEKDKKRLSWFWKWFLNNQFVTALLIILLILLILNAFTKVSYLFEPVAQFVGVVGLPIVLAGVFYYLMNPAVDYLEKKGLKRIYSIFLLFLLVIGLITWGVVVIVPKIREQTASFIDNFPNYLDVIDQKANEILNDPIFGTFKDQFDSYGDKITTWLTDFIRNVSSSTISSLGKIVGAVASTLVAIFTMPFILFYLLKDGRNLAPYFVKFLPNKIRKPTLKVLKEMNEQVSSYIRGQLTVAFAVAIMFIIGFSIIGLDYSVTLGVVAGFLNLIPYLGSFLAMVPAIFLGIVAGPVMLVKVLVVFVIEQTIEGRLISPLVLGNELSVHPVTILLVLLTSGKLFGVVGVILGIPVYAAAKVLITHLFEWYKDVSQYYHEEEKAEEEK